MKYDCLLAGVGGQGVLSIASVIARSALKAGISVRQSEVHGMAQRGGAVAAHLRLAGPFNCSEKPAALESVIAGDLVPKGGANLIIAIEPLESLRYLSWLSPEGILVSSAEPFINIPNYPEFTEIEKAVKSLPKSILIKTTELAKKTGFSRTVNMVMAGAASLFLPIPEEMLESAIREMFIAQDPKLAEANASAFKLGRAESRQKIVN